MKIADLPPVSEMMRRAGITPKKSLGQNFLFDLNITRKIARSVPDIDTTTIVEVGPGPGGLSRALLECGAAKVIAIEKDIAVKPILDEIAAASNQKFHVIYGDALKEFPNLDTFAICANLPYNVGTVLLVNWLSNRQIKSMTLMFQKEVAERIVAPQSTKQYGRLSVIAQLGWDAKILFTVPNTAFVPAPKVTSAVIQLIPKKNAPDLKSVQKLTAVLFGQRRKMIRSILPDIDWKRFGLVGTERAEQLAPEKFLAISNALYN